MTRVMRAGISCFFVSFLIQPSLLYAAPPADVSTQGAQSETPTPKEAPVHFDSSVAAPAGIPTGSTTGMSITSPTGSIKVPAAGAAMTQAEFDTTLLALREASSRNDASAAMALSSRLLALSSFPATSAEVTPLLRAYIDYFGIKPLLFESDGSVRSEIPEATLQSVHLFLKRYAGSALADRMRNNYLLVLGAQKDWKKFEENAPLFILNDDVQVKAYALIARAQRGENVAAAARALLVDPRQYGDAGIDLITLLAEQKQFSPQDVWNQLRLTYRVNRHSMAKKIAKALGPDAPSNYVLDEAALRPLALLSEPSSQSLAYSTNISMRRQLILLALTQMARYNSEGAALAFTPLASQLTAKQQATGWTIIAYWGAINHSPEALTWYRLTGNAPFVNSTFEWRVRAALLAGSWKDVREAIEAMPPALQAQSTWTYWLARALQEEPDTSLRAKALFTKIASGFDFYSLLAREALGQPLAVPNRVVVSDADIAKMRQKTGFALTQRLYAAHLYFEGSREWNWLLRGMNDRQLLTVANYAQQIGLYDRAVNTAERTRSLYDFSLRYPMPDFDIIGRHAKDANIDLNWVYGLIRQESRFLSKAQSSVGAMGLMQVMPSTAKRVAKRIGLENFDLAKLAEVQTNTLIGTRYLSQLHEQFSGSDLLATAGYNAGPNRVNSWLKTLPRTVEGAIFAETIPFDETRTYVKNVLSNAAYYDVILKKGNLKRPSLTKILGSITLSSEDTELEKL